MRKKRLFKSIKVLTLLLLWAVSFYTFAQNTTVRGTVRDSSGDPLIGVTIHVRGTSSGTVTDQDGKFVFQGIPQNSILEVSYVGDESSNN